MRNHRPIGVRGGSVDSLAEVVGELIRHVTDETRGALSSLHEEINDFRSDIEEIKSVLKKEFYSDMQLRDEKLRLEYSKSLVYNIELLRKEFTRLVEILAPKDVVEKIAKALASLSIEVPEIRFPDKIEPHIDFNPTINVEKTDVHVTNDMSQLKLKAEVDVHPIFKVPSAPSPQVKVVNDMSKVKLNAELKMPTRETKKHIEYDGFGRPVEIIEQEKTTGK